MAGMLKARNSAEMRAYVHECMTHYIISPKGFKPLTLYAHMRA